MQSVATSYVDRLVNEASSMTPDARAQHVRQKLFTSTSQVEVHIARQRSFPSCKSVAGLAFSMLVVASKPSNRTTAAGGDTNRLDLVRRWEAIYNDPESANDSSASVAELLCDADCLFTALKAIVVREYSDSPWSVPDEVR
jgi:hypothetical protein